MIEIKRNNEVIFSTPINEGCLRRCTLMQEDYVTLKFNLTTPIYLKLGDSIMDGAFEIVDLTAPTYNENTGAYEYEVRFDAYYWKWKNKKFFYSPEHGAREAVWNLTADLPSQLKVFLRNLKYLGYNYNGQDFEFVVNENVDNKSISMHYDKVNLIDALTMLAEAWECEWWITDNVINFGRCEYGTPVDFKLNDNVQSMIRNDGQQSFATRIYAFGSARNIPRDYRPHSDEVAINGIIDKRLMLPEGTPFIDAYPNMKQEEAIEEVVIFDEIYPSRTNEITEVREKEGSTTEEGATTNFWTYWIKDESLEFKDEYILPNEELRITFQSGALNGMDFALGFHEDSNEFEIIRNEDYGRLLPDDVLKPKVRDKFILYGYDTKFIDDQLLPEAELRLKEKAIEYVEKLKVDPSTYENKMMSDFMFNKGEIRAFELGDKVNLINPTYFEESRVSRIIGYEYPLDKPYDNPTYYVGETASYSRLNELEGKVNELVYKDQIYQSTHKGVYLITQHDSTKPTDRNVFSALRSLNTFLRKDRSDKTEYLLQLLGGAEFGEYINSLTAGKGAAIDKDGKAQVESLEVRSYLKVLELIYNRLSAIEGDIVFTESGLIEKVEKIDDTTYRLTFRKRWDNDFIALHEGDVLRGIVNNLTAGGEYYTSWTRVLNVNTSANTATVVVYPNEETPAGKNFAPTEKMVVHRWGNAVDKSRQTTWYLSSTEGRIMFLNGVTKPILDESNYSAFWGKPIKLKAFEDKPINYEQPYFYARGALIQDLIRVDYQGNPIIDYKDRGKWEQGREYTDGRSYPYEGDDVWHLDCRWRCIVESTTQEPSWNATDWAMVSGNEKLSLELYSDGGNIYRPNTSFKINLEAKVFMGNEDITAFIENADWKWTRETNNINGDNAWNEKHAGTTHQLTITQDDMEDLADYTKFICTAYVRDGKEIKKIEKEIMI